MDVLTKGTAQFVLSGISDPGWNFNKILLGVSTY